MRDIDTHCTEKHTSPILFSSLNFMSRVLHSAAFQALLENRNAVYGAMMLAC